MKKIVLIFLCFLFIHSVMNAQTLQYNNKNNLNCSTPGVNSYPPGYLNKLSSNIQSSFVGTMVHKTPVPGQFLRILILYVRFPDDNLVGNNMNGFAVWPDPTMPRPLNPYTTDHSFIDSAEGDPNVNFMERYRQYTISDYFCEMSRGEFDVVGDEYSVLLPHTSTEYKEMGYNCSQINEEAIKLADAQYNIDFSRYNNWTYDPDGWIWAPGGGDNYADMIVMEYRKAPGYPDESNWFIDINIPVSGISDLGQMNGFILDGVNISSGSGVTCLSVLQNYTKMTQIMLHELSHRYFFNHFEIGLMTGVEHSCLNYSPFERKTLEYISPIEITFPYLEQTQTYTLGDYISTGDIIELELPVTGEKYYIANHQKVSVYDGISRGGKNCWKINAAQQDPYCPDGKGLYIYHQMNASRCNEFKEVKLVQADGKYDWYIDRMVPYFIPEFNFTIPLFERLNGNVRGKSEFHQVIDSVFTNMQEVTDNPCSDNPDDYFVTYDWLGDGKDAYNMGYDELLSPYSNPSSVTCSGFQTGLSIKLLEQDSVTGSIKIKIYYNDKLALQELAPAKPKNLKTSKFIFEPSTGRFHPSLSWDKNTEPDFMGVPLDHGHYNIYRGVLADCNPDSEPAFNFVGSVSSDSNSFIDNGISLYPEGGGTVLCTNLFRSVYYRIEAVDLSSLASLRSDASIINGYDQQCDDSILVGIHGNQLPVKFAIFNYPNPFNPVTKINYSLPQGSFVNLKIYNLLGEEISSPVKNEFKNAGYYNVVFDGSNLPSGVYFYKIEAGSYVESRKMVLVK
ncbi:MAG: T9SS type A sorting domain-containing protein [Ignavibacteria bacterium]